MSRIEESATLTVVVFDSVNPDYFMAHWDLKADRARVASMAPGPTGLHPYLDNLVRLSKVPAVTISAIRGRVRGAGSEFVLATDIRFAGDKAELKTFLHERLAAYKVPSIIEFAQSLPKSNIGKILRKELH